MKNTQDGAGNTVPLDSLVGWQPIETAPSVKKILCYELGAYYAAEHSHGSWAAYCGQHVTETPEPTHWMPLPKPPNDQNKGK